MDKKTCSEFVDNLSNLNVRLGTNTKFGDNDLKSWLIANLMPRAGEKVLDIGCGNGTYLREVAQKVGGDESCFGIDYDSQMIKEATERSKGFTPTITFIHMDMDRVGDPDSPFKNEFFDLIFSVYAFYYSKDALKTLDALKTKLKPDGRISIVGPYADNNKGWFDFLNQFMELPASIVDSSTTFMEKIGSYAKENFSDVIYAEFVNNITIPSYESLQNYWVSNIYYDAENDQSFEKYAREHFANNSTFRFFKKAQMITMRRKN
jgi:SAM-dependent methyltransferase